MRILRALAEMRQESRLAHLSGKRVGLVPTMGAFHEGHLSLMRRARQASDVVVVSLFVNAAQFNDSSDFSAYPRHEQHDADLAASAGVDYLFAPSGDEMYPAGFATHIDVGALGDPLEGKARGPAHFRGVATVVAKLFNIVEPDVAFFGQKDAQQVVVVGRIARDLDFPVEIEVCPTVREPDGLAMSSRNVRLSGGSRPRAAALIDTLRAVADAVGRGERSAAALAELGQTRLAQHGIPAAEVDYLAIVDPETLAPVSQVDSRTRTLLAIAARVGGVRLIDNIVIGPA